MQNIIHLATLLALLMAGTVQAQTFYRCTDSAGKVLLSDKACDNSAVDASRFVLKPNSLDSSEGRAQDMRQENQRLREQLGQQQQAPQQVQGGGPNYACMEAQRTFNRTQKAADRTLMNGACMGSAAAAQIEETKARNRPVITNCNSFSYGYGSSTNCVSR